VNTQTTLTLSFDPTSVSVAVSDYFILTHPTGVSFAQASVACENLLGF